MLPEIKLTISQNDKLIKQVTKTIEKQSLVKSLEEFQVEANDTLTKMIEELGDITQAGGDTMDDDDDEDENDDKDENESDDEIVDKNDDENEDENDDDSGTENQRGHSKSKKKKHN